MNSQLLIIWYDTLSFSCLCASFHNLHLQGLVEMYWEELEKFYCYFPKEKDTHPNLIEIKLVNGQGTSLYFCLFYAIWENYVPYVLPFTVSLNNVILNYFFS